jgi:hypothetical protein
MRRIVNRTVFLVVTVMIQLGSFFLPGRHRGSSGAAARAH